MKINLFRIFLPVVLFLASLFIPANATITSEYDIQNKISQIQQLGSLDFDQFVNKPDLIGYRRANYKMFSAQYSSTANMTAEQLRTIYNQILLLKNTSEISDTDKTMQYNNLYFDADKILYNLDNQTLNYVNFCRNTMPTVTYQKFAKRFLAYYNSLQISGNELNLKW